MKNRPCPREVIVSTDLGSICRCSCGTYYFRFDLMTLCFTQVEFEKVARLFKFALGRIVGREAWRSTSKNMPEAFWGKPTLGYRGKEAIWPGIDPYFKPTRH